MNKIVLFVLLVLTNFYTFSWNSHMVYSIQKYGEMYSRLEIMQLEAGLTPNTSAYPLTRLEVERILEELERYKNDIELDALLEDFKNSLKEDKIFGAELSTEYYIGVEDLSRSNSPLELELNVGLGDIYWGFVNIPVRTGIDITADDISIPTNLSIFSDIQMIDLQLPNIAMSSVGGELWNLSFGRDLLSYGDGSTGNLVISDAAYYHDFIRLKGWGEYFNYNCTMISMEALDVEGLQESFGDLESENGLQNIDDNDEFKVLFSHNLDINPFKNLRITIHEAFLRGGTANVLSFFNPLMILHNLAITDNKFTEDDRLLGNSVLSLAANYTPIKGLSLYGEYIQDQFETASEAGRLGDDYQGEPDAYGMLFGLNYSKYINKNMHLFFNGEWAYTNPHLYRSVDSLNLYAYTWTHHSIFNNTNEVITDPLGYEYGPDVKVLKLGLLGKFFNYKLSVGVDYYYVEKGERTLDDEGELGQEASELSTPSGEVEISHIIDTEISYNFGDGLKAYIKTSNDEVIIGCSYSY